LTRVCHVAWCSGRSPKDWQIGIIIPQNGRQGRMYITYYRGSLSLASLEKCMSNAVEELNEKWKILRAFFVLAVARQTKFSLSSKFSGNLGSMPKTSTHVLVISRKHTTRFLVKSACCGSTVFADACSWPSSHCISVCVGGLCHNCSLCVFDTDKGVCCHHSTF